MYFSFCFFLFHIVYDLALTFCSKTVFTTDVRLLGGNWLFLRTVGVVVVYFEQVNEDLLLTWNEYLFAE